MTTSTRFSRRSMLASIIGGTIAGLPAIAAASSALSGPDGLLIARCDEWLAWNKRYYQLGDELCQAEGDGSSSYGSLDEQMQAHVSSGHELWEAIFLLQATTMKGVMAKAAVMMGSCPDNIENEIIRLEGSGMEPNVMALSTMRDFLAVTKSASLS